MNNADNANKQFTCSYKFDDVMWGVTIWASTYEEAEMKLKAAGKGKVDGVIMAKTPANDSCPTCGK
jgi:hypothetical protein